ncbi:MAG: hypothetical protein A2902_05865 [Elusimicrobia bacterium RIFCSPLOWO2_01_FULL_64_13]|nr:MAG: hypothetical protein A2636_04430 [Elusimicrobia bacterium RIFCSPHIGHO2_01_FULL_64_10]OGR94274.1 MAG: hypothetical protein A2902_05865 [Elusimicrobia bacterium RIFCSPLOWO2_01_FULL_64_13]
MPPPASSAVRKVKVRGLARIAGWILVLWGGLVSLIGLYDAFFGEPEANFYSLEKWEFVTQSQWLRWSGFETAYGLACAGLGLACWEFAKRLPDWIERAAEPSGSFPGS